MLAGLASHTPSLAFASTLYVFVDTAHMWGHGDEAVSERGRGTEMARLSRIWLTGSCSSVQDAPPLRRVGLRHPLHGHCDTRFPSQEAGRHGCNRVSSSKSSPHTSRLDSHEAIHTLPNAYCHYISFTTRPTAFAQPRPTRLKCRGRSYQRLGSARIGLMRGSISRYFDCTPSFCVKLVETGQVGGLVEKRYTTFARGAPLPLSSSYTYFIATSSGEAHRLVS